MNGTICYETGIDVLNVLNVGTVRKLWKFQICAAHTLQPILLVPVLGFFLVANRGNSLVEV